MNITVEILRTLATSIEDGLEVNPEVLRRMADSLEKSSKEIDESMEAANNDKNKS